MDEGLSKIIVYVVMVAWVISFLADLVIASYEPSLFVQAAFMAVVGAATGRIIYLRNGGEQKK